MNKEVVIILSNVRSCYNVGSIFRTADAAGASTVVCCGITPYPRLKDDSRLEKVIINNTKMIHKTALDAETSVRCLHFESTVDAIKHYKERQFEIIALENKVDNTQNIFTYQPNNKKIALVVGSETDGLHKDVLKICNSILEIPMYGIKNSLNASVAVGIALYAILTN